MNDVQLLLACALLGACADHGGAGVDSGGMVATLGVGASAGTVTDAFRLTASGTAGAPWGALSFSADVGTIDVGDGAVAAFVYTTVAEGAYTLYNGFAVSPTSWDAFYLYCNAGAVSDVYDEQIGGHGMVYAAVTNSSCLSTATSTIAQVALPAFSIPAPAPIPGYTVTGSRIQIAADGTGTLALAGSTLPLVVFDNVDCAACGGAGWSELHSLVLDDANQRVVFVIVYLITGMTSSVELAYARSLPDLADPIGTLVLDATWSVPHGARASRAPRGTRPPRVGDVTSPGPQVH